MRVPSLAVLLILAAATPATAQNAPNVDRRLERIEKELRAVQRKVFPGGAGVTVEPEIGPAQPDLGPAGVPASSAIADLTARVDALEAQLRTLTNQAEENGHRMRQLEQAVAQFRSEAEARAAAPSTSGSNLSEEGSTSPQGAEEAPAPSTGDPGEDAYLTGFRLWNAGKHTEAQQTLEAMVKKYPKHPRASFAQNLLGRAYLDGGKPATAAKVLLGNYQNNPKGERAPDSLYFLGQALVKLKRTSEACKVYDELQEVYGANLRAWVKDRLPKARADAKCS